MRHRSPVATRRDMSHRRNVAACVALALSFAAGAAAQSRSGDDGRSDNMRMPGISIEGERQTPDIFFVFPTGKGGNVSAPRLRDYGPDILDPVVKPWFERDQAVNPGLQQAAIEKFDWNEAMKEAPPPAREPEQDVEPIAPAAAAPAPPPPAMPAEARQVPPPSIPSQARQMPPPAMPAEELVMPPTANRPGRMPDMPASASRPMSAPAEVPSSRREYVPQMPALPDMPPSASRSAPAPSAYSAPASSYPPPATSMRGVPQSPPPPRPAEREPVHMPPPQQFPAGSDEPVPILVPPQ